MKPKAGMARSWAGIEDLVNTVLFWFGDFPAENVHTAGVYVFRGGAKRLTGAGRDIRAGRVGLTALLLGFLLTTRGLGAILILLSSSTFSA